MMFDCVIRGATVHDGIGSPPFLGDLAVKDGKIADIGQLDGASAPEQIDARGKVLCPGFVDVHSHADTIVHWPDHEQVLEPLLRQGITTFVGGNCGLGLAPLKPERRAEVLMYLEAFLGRDQQPLIEWETVAQLMETLDTRGVVMNCALLAPHGIMRLAAMGAHRGAPTRDQMATMKALLAESLEAGVLGMSTGLQYFPGLCADEHELVELAALLAPKDAVFTSHIRSYANTLDEAIDELIRVSRRSGARVQLSHLFWVPHFTPLIDRALGVVTRLAARIYRHVKIPVPLHLLMQGRLDRIDRLIRSGLPMGVDAMPTGAGFTHAFAFFPPWALEGTKQDILARIADKHTRKKIYASIMNGRPVWPHRGPDTWSMNFFLIMGFESVHLMSVATPDNERYVGMSFVEIGKARGQHPFDAICDMLLEEDGKVLVFETPTWPGDEFVERSVYGAIADPNVSIATDTIRIGNGKPSHLFYDCFPKLLSKYVRGEKLLTLPEAIRKATSLPATQLGIPKRGELRRGYWADLVLFDADTIASRSTPAQPDASPSGVEYVFVNGKAVVSPAGYHPQPRAGRVIRRGEG